MQGLLDFFGLGSGGASPATPQAPVFGFPGMTPEEQAFARQRSMNALLGTIGPSLMAASQGGIPLAQAGALRAQAMSQAAQAPMAAMQAGDQASQQMLQQRMLRTQLAQRENQMRLGASMANVIMGGAGGGAQAPAPAGAPPAPEPAAMPAPAAPASQPLDLDLAARVLHMEAGNQGPEGLAAVAHVIRNRANLTGRSLSEVVSQPGQFEPFATRRDQINALRPEQYADARRVIEGVVAGQIPDPTRGATHFLNPELVAQRGGQRPAWAPEGQGMRIGAHEFFSIPQDFRQAGNAPLTPTQAALTTPVSGAAPGAARSPAYNSLASMPPELRAMVGARFAAGDIEGGTTLAAQWMTRNPPNVQTVTVGGRVRELRPDASLGQDYGSASEQAMILSPQQAQRLLGQAFDPRQAYYLDQNGAPRVVGNPSTNVTINTDNAGREMGVRRINAEREAIDGQARELLPRLQILQETLATGVATGRIEDATLGFRQIAQSLGLLTEDQARTADQQGLVRAMSAAIIPRMRVAGAGASSDLDVRMFTQAAPGLARSPEGNIVLTAIMGQTIRGEQARVEAMERYFADNNGSLIGFDRWWRENGTPLFSRVPADMTPQRMLEEFAPGSVVILPDSARGRVPTFPFYVIPLR